MMSATTVDVREVYDRFFALGGPPPDDLARPWRYRRAGTSMGWPTVQLLAALVRERRPARVLDLGSGLTSLILRALMAEVPGMTVVTTDTSPGWLIRTMGELKRDGLPVTDCYIHATFETSPAAREQYDLISVDIDNTPFRRNLATSLAQWLGRDGVMLLDDWHIQPYAPTMTTRLEELGLVVLPQPETVDTFGRFAALAQWRDAG